MFRDHYYHYVIFFFFQAEDGIRDYKVTGVQTCALPISIPHEDDADRAMKCGLGQLEALEKMNKKWKAEGRPELGVGIGINFGEVFAGYIGSDRRLEYTVIGDAVNVASRLCSIAGPDEILISEPFYKALKKPPRVEALEPLQVKGKTQKVPVYRVKR